MTREEARKAAEVMMAYAEGKEIEFKNGKGMEDEWYNYNSHFQPLFNWGETDYRIKKEPTYRPFKNKEECWNEMQKHQPFGWVVYNKQFTNIAYIDKIGVIFRNDGKLDNMEYETSVTRLVFADGVPFGIKEE